MVLKVQLVVKRVQRVLQALLVLLEPQVLWVDPMMVIQVLRVLLVPLVLRAPLEILVLRAALAPQVQRVRLVQLVPLVRLVLLVLQAMQV